MKKVDLTIEVITSKLWQVIARQFARVNYNFIDLKLKVKIFAKLEENIHEYTCGYDRIEELILQVTAEYLVKGKDGRFKEEEHLEYFSAPKHLFFVLQCYIVNSLKFQKEEEEEPTVMGSYVYYF